LETADDEGPRYQQLLGDGSRWRIDWFGQVHYPNRMYRSGQPSVVLHLSKLNGTPTTLADWLSPNLTDANQHTQTISIGALPHFAVGDVWTDGRQESVPDYELETFTDVQVDANTTSIIKAGLNPDEEGFLLPLSQHPWHRECTQSYCVRLVLPDGRRLIVPCMELIRFYFGSSSNLISQLFLPPFERSRFCTKNDYDFLRGHRHLTLGERMPGRSAEDIARLVHERGWESATQLGASILRRATSNEKIYPIFNFPFTGKTTLIAAGKWVSYGKRERDTFVVFNLRSCTAAFPYRRSLSYQTAKGHDARSRERFPPDAQNENIQVKRSIGDRTDGKVVDKDPSKTLKKRDRNFNMNRKFPDLEKKTSWKSKVVEAESQGRIVMRRADSNVDEADGDASGSQRVRSVDFLEALAVDGGKRAEVPAFLKDVVADLMKLKDVKIRVLTASDEDGWSVPVPLICDDDGVIDPRLFIIDENDKTRLRRTSLFEINASTETKHVVALEFVNTLGAPSAHTVDKKEQPIDAYAVLSTSAKEFLLSTDSPHLATKRLG
jgi:hypothetical protein